MAGHSKSFTEEDQRMVQLLLNNLTGNLPVNWEKAAAKGGYSNAKSLKDCWRKRCAMHGWNKYQPTGQGQPQA